LPGPSCSAGIPSSGAPRGVRDSKQTTGPSGSASWRDPAPRCDLGVGVVSPQEIDPWASSPPPPAMEQAFGRFPAADALLIDHLRLPGVDLRQVSLPRGMPSSCRSPARSSPRRTATADGASGRPVPLYALPAQGLGTPQHRAALASWAVRRPPHSFAPVRSGKREPGMILPEVRWP